MGGMFRDRAQLEREEAERLARYASLSGQSKGRVYPEEEPAYRTAFQRDRDRIVHSAAFRRLEYKTQVFANDEGDYYRTRLTHTLEVAQIGRTIARALGVNEDLVETICLAHDLGHPPFGHAGEHALDEAMRDAGGFNHNFQGYRLVTELERRYERFPGLNLTCEALSGMVSHETDFPLSAAAGFDPSLRGHLEAQIADITDQLTYNAHDLDDGLISGLIEPEMLNELDIWRLLCERIGYKGGAARLDEITRHHFIRELIGVFVDDVITTTRENLERTQPASAEAVQHLSEDLVCYSPQVAAMGQSLKAFLYRNMYYSYRVVRMQQRAGRFIQEMFKTFDDDPRQLPPECQVEMKTRDPKCVIADYIASMTDRSALLEYRRLFDPNVSP